jgi:hypothetical protein
VNCDLSFQLGAPLWGQGLKRGMLIGEQSVASDWRNRDAKETRSRRWYGLKAPVRVPIFGEQRGLFIGRSSYGDNVRSSRNRRDEWVLTELAERERKSLQIIVAHRLIRECENVVLQPCDAYFGHRFVRERNRQIDPLDARAAGLTARFD